MNTFSKCLFAGLIGTTLLSSCSRPVAYFQPSVREQFAASPAPIAAVVEPEAITTPAPIAADQSVHQVAGTTTAVNQIDALVRNDRKIAADKTVQKRLHRVRNLLLAASTKTTLAPAATNAPKKMNLMERLMLKKMNKKINRQLAPANPEKTMVSSGTLATGAVLVIVGLLLLLLASGTLQTVGLIALLVGAVVLLIGLL